MYFSHFKKNLGIFCGKRGRGHYDFVYIKFSIYLQSITLYFVNYSLNSQL